MPRTARVSVDVPLGSLTQSSSRLALTCSSCGSDRVTRIAMNLTDGSPVELTACRACENRTWEQYGRPLPLSAVLAKSRKTG